MLKNPILPLIGAVILSLSSGGFVTEAKDLQRSKRATTTQSTALRTIPFSTYRVFEEPIVWFLSEPSLKELEELENVLRSFSEQKDFEDTSAFEDFIDKFPNSPLAPSLLTNLGVLTYRQGYFSRALRLFERSWEIVSLNKSKELSSADKALYSRTLGELLRMYARLGRVSDVRRLLPFAPKGEVPGKAAAYIRGAGEALWHMEHHPETSFQCGPQALNEIQKSLGKNIETQILSLHSTPNGTNLAQLAAKAKEAKLSFEMVKRVGSTPLPLPAVVHWKAGHFAAVILKDNDKFLIKDPTFDDELWISEKALFDEGSGYFLIPTSKVTSSYKKISKAEGSKVWGKGVTTTSDEGESRDDSESGGGGCGRDGQCCGGAGGGSGGSGGSGGGPSGGDGPFAGMAQYKVHLMLIGLSIFDTPIGYKPPVGPAVKCKVTYNSKEASHPSVLDYTNFGDKWNFSYLAYVKDNPSLSTAPITIVRRNGGTEKLTWSTTFSRYLQDLRSRAQLTKVSTSPIVYENVLPDGSKEVYSESDGGLTARRVFLTELIDPQGNSLTFDYDYPSGGGIRLVSITDEIGQVTELEYGLVADIFKVTKITDPFGREAIFDYDTSTPPRLESITDVIGLTSEFPAPTTPGESFTLTTPYGTTEFTYSSAASTSPEAWLEAEDPLGDVERFEFKHSATGISATESPVPSVPSKKFAHL